VRLASEREIQRQREQLQHAAFIGWQVRDVVMSALGSKQRPHYQQYLVSLGLAEKIPKRSMPLEQKGAGEKNASRVREAFRQMGMRKA